jgi:hypothetical protein
VARPAVGAGRRVEGHTDADRIEDRPASSCSSPRCGAAAFDLYQAAGR